MEALVGGRQGRSRLKNTGVIALVWLATAGVAWFAGTQTAGRGTSVEVSEDSELFTLREENESLRQQLRDRGPGLEAGARPGRRGGSAGRSSAQVIRYIRHSATSSPADCNQGLSQE